MGRFSSASDTTFLYKLEPSFGTISETGSAKEIRRISADFNLKEENTSFAPISSHRQASIVFGGVRTVEGSINAELSPTTFSDFIGALLGRNFEAQSAIYAINASIIPTATQYVYEIVTDGSLDLIEGVQPGSTVRLQNTINPAENDIDVLVVKVTATVLTIKTFNSHNMVSETNSVLDIVPLGQGTHIPSSSFTDKSFTIERWDESSSFSEIYSGNKVSSFSVNVDLGNYVTCDFGFVGKQLVELTNTKKFNSSTRTLTSPFTSNQSYVSVGEDFNFPITSHSFTISQQTTAAHSVGNQYPSKIAKGVYEISGTFTAFVENNALLSYFTSSQNLKFICVLGNEQYITFCFPCIKIVTLTKSTNGSANIITADFTAIRDGSNSSVYVSDTGFSTIFDALTYLVTSESKYYTTDDGDQFVLKG